MWATTAANANNEAATSTCGDETLIVPQNKPSIVTHLHNAGSDGLVGGTGTAADTDLSDGDSVAIGTSIYDTATVTGAATPNPTVTYHIAGPFSGAFAATNCDAGTAIGTGANSDVQTLTAAGRYELWATTAANANNEAATSTCGDETLIVPQNKPSIVTHLHNAGSDGLVGGTGTAADTDLSDGDSVAIGTSIYDTATVTGAATPNPTVTYHIAGPFSGAFAATNCDAGTAIGTGANSDVQTLTAAGRYELWATTAANANNEAATSTCGDETLIVPQNKPSIVTHLHNAGSDGLVGGTGTAADTDLSDGDSVAIGTSIYDTATVTGAATPNPTVTYHIAGPFSGAFAATNCDAGTAIGTGANSDVQTLTAAGRDELWATTAANANNEAATSTCGDETLIVPQEQALDRHAPAQRGFRRARGRHRHRGRHGPVRRRLGRDRHVDLRHRDGHGRGHTEPDRHLPHRRAVLRRLRRDQLRRWHRDRHRGQLRRPDAHGGWPLRVVGNDRGQRQQRGGDLDLW